MSSNQDQNKKEEPTFSIQPAPSNPPQTGAGLNSNPEIAAFHAKGAYVPPNEILNSLSSEPALSKEELKKRTEELNK